LVHASVSPQADTNPVLPPSPDVFGAECREDPSMIGPLFPELLAAAQGGDEQAFAMLWRDLQPAVLRYFRVVGPEAAEDLAADTWVSVIRGLGRFRGDERAFRAWLFTVARHRAIDWRRQAARRPTSSIPVAQFTERPAPDDPVAAVLEAHSTRAALALLAELPADQAEVVALRVLGGLEVAEVARIVGKRPGAVRVLAHRGLRRLAKRVEAAGLVRGVTR
jgi:RNA polymerase sigma-70 factor (ECF subfamily)